MNSIRNLGIAIALGVGIGLAMGVAFHQTATGAAIGVAVGIAAAGLTLAERCQARQDGTLRATSN